MSSLFLLQLAYNSARSLISICIILSFPIARTTSFSLFASVTYHSQFFHMSSSNDDSYSLFDCVFSMVKTRDFLHRPRLSSVYSRVLLYTDRVLRLQRIQRFLLLKHSACLVPFCTEMFYWFISTLADFFSL